MASMQGQAPNADLFDAYFRRADLDSDGRISGAEAVAFFQGSGLSKLVLAKIWDYADHSKSGYLGRKEFYNALKLVTVAQSKKELTPEIVKAALYGPVAAKIPAPRISQPAPQSNYGVPSSASSIGSIALSASDDPGPVTPQLPPNANVNQQRFPAQGSQLWRPPLPSHGTGLTTPQGVGSQGFPGGSYVGRSYPLNSVTSGNMVGGITSGAPAVAASQVPSRGISPSIAPSGFGPAALGSTAPLPPRPPAASKMVQMGQQAKTLGVSGNGHLSSSASGGNTVISSQPQQDSLFGNTPSTMQPASVQLLQAHSLVKQHPHVSTKSTPAFRSAGVSIAAGNSASGQSQESWPKMTQTDIQKYMKVFVAVDTDKDGKITGEQARNLFLSWRLPREVLKKVWDLSDQDNDSMLSHKEFCIALYLLERQREGHTLPAVLPSSIYFEQSPTGASVAGHSAASWEPKSGFQQQSTPAGFVSQNIPPAAGLKSPIPVPAPVDEEAPQINQQKSKVPVLEKHLVDQLSKEEQDTLKSKFEEATKSEKKVEELEKEILDSRQKIEFYHAKMRELVLYKSRCENRLNEITERVSSDKCEVEVLAKNYEEKYTQKGDVVSRLTIEEATFRDIQEKKMELYHAIIKMDQDGGANESFQERVEQIQADIDELVKSLSERCKQYGLRGRATSLLELPFGWQPGIQEGSADWDEEWDKFEDEGFTFVKEFTLGVRNVVAPPKPKPMSVQTSASTGENGAGETATDTTSPRAEDIVESEKLPDIHEKILENGSAYGKSEDDTARSMPTSPVARCKPESPGAGSVTGGPSKDFEESNSWKTVNAEMAIHDKNTNSGHGVSVPMFDNSFDEPSWGTFDTTDNANSVWSFNPVRSTKDNVHENFEDNNLFGSENFGLNPIRTHQPVKKSTFSFDESVPSTPLYSTAGSPQKLQKRSTFSFDDSVPSTPLYGTANSPRKFQKKNTFSFDESVPSTPLYSIAGSPQKYREGSRPSFDSFSRSDSFNTQASGRYDSFRSNTDDSEPFGTVTWKTSVESETSRRFSDSHLFGRGPYGTSMESQTPRGFSDADSSGSRPFNTSMESQTPRRFSDADPFGSGLFTTSPESQTPRKGSDSAPFGTGTYEQYLDNQTYRSSFDYSDLFGSKPVSTSGKSQTPGSSNSWSSF